MKAKIRKLSDDQCNKIIEDYKNGESSNKIAEKLNIHSQTIRNFLKRNNIKIRQKGLKTYNLDEKFFDKIDSEEKAYFLGFIFADGCNTGMSLNIHVAKKDIDILNKFKKAIKYSGDIKLCKPRKIGNSDYISGPSCLIKICRKYICDALIKLGCDIQKTNRIKFPEENIVPKYLIRHFIRGYFDGDGSLHVPKHHPRADVTIAGCPLLMSQMKDFLVNQLDIYLSCKIYKNRNYSMIQGSSIENLMKFLDYLYKDATVFLNRKYNKYQDFIKYKYNKIIN